MLIPYYSPNLSWAVFLAFYFQKNGRDKITHFFKELTGKKYILITNSCRTALYLAYKSIGDPGDVITSPLTCKSAIDPIVASEFEPVYCDILLSDLNMDADDAAGKITGKTRAIQVIHLGGIACDMGKIAEIAKKHNIYIIEDCAQALGAKYNGRYCGSFGDVACFSLIKNGYGIGGGILATDNQAIYENAVSINNYFANTSGSLILYRLMRNFLESHRRTILGNILYKKVMHWRRYNKNYQNEKSFQKQLVKASDVEIKLFAAQLDRLPFLHKKRRQIGQSLYNRLKNENLILNGISALNECSFSKFYAYHPGFIAPQTIQKLDNFGIEAKHLEHKYQRFYQKKLIADIDGDNVSLPNYRLVHDHLLSLPVCEHFQKKEIVRIILSLKREINFAQNEKNTF
jgi:dTDP-4-amino-4,6-dideoxygalactose transaminase